MSGIRKKDYRRFSMNMAVTTMEHDRLQGWLTVASAIETGKKMWAHSVCCTQKFSISPRGREGGNPPLLIAASPLTDARCTLTIPFEGPLRLPKPLCIGVGWACIAKK